MKILNIVETAVDGPHLRTSIYFAGCNHHCKGCHNPETWEFNQGEDMTPFAALEKIKEFGNKYITLSGGDPLYQPKEVYTLLELIKENIPNADIWCYTGFRFEELLCSSSTIASLLQYIDVLVDGPFVLELRDTNLLFKGSSNQRIINVKQSLKENKVILWA